AGEEVGHAEGFHVIVGIALRQVGLKAESEIQAEVWTDAPCILHVETVIIRSVVVVERTALAECVELSGQEISVAQSRASSDRGELAREVEIAIHAACVLSMHVGANILPAEGKLMLAPDEREVD